MKKYLKLIVISTLVFSVCEEKIATLTIKNESFTEITDVMWQNVSFANNKYEKSIKPGTTVTMDVQPGGGYIFFKRKSSPISARTRDLVIVGSEKNINFVFLDSTVIVEVNNPNNNGTLGTLQSTVVFWDDAEGEMQRYYLKQSFVEYYSKKTISYYNDCYEPKNSEKSIRIGGTNTALLHLKIDLTKNAKLSFWYANKVISDGATFSINGVEKAKWTTEVDWSFMTFDLKPGENNIIWAIKGRGGFDINYKYLSLDDILIYYTE